MTRSEKLKRCVGCRNNFYNGQNNLGVKECWSLKTMKLRRAVKVPIWEVPPHTQPAASYPTCYSPSGYALLDPEGVKQQTARIKSDKLREAPDEG